MNNCVKCGNPLQPGVTSCPICGTVAQPSNENLTDPVGTGTLEQPASAPTETIETAQPAPASVPEPAPTAVAEPAPAPTPTPEVAPAPAAVQTPAPAPEVAPAPAVQTPAPAPAPEAVMAAPAPDANGFASPATPMPEDPAPAPELAPAAPQPAQAVDFSAAQPPQTFQANGAPSVGDINPMNPEASFNQMAAQAAPQQVTIENVTKKEKGSILPTILVAIVAVLAGAAGGYFLNPMLNKPVVVPQVEASSVAARSNGFSFDIEKDWIYNQYGDKVIVNNADESLTLRIGKSSGDFNDISLTNIENSLNNKQGYTDIKVEKTKIEEVDVIFVDCKNEELFIQYYYLANDESTVITVVVVYETETAKTAAEENVKNLVKTLKYTDEAVKAIGAVNMYASKFDDATYAFFDALVPEENTPTEQTDNNETTPENGQVVE